MKHDAPTSLWLLRHPEPAPETRGRCYGSLDVELSPQGLQQAYDVAANLEPQTLAAIYTSPRRRCRQAAAILAMGRECPVDALEQLTELHFGDFEGRTYEDIAATYPDVYRQWMERPTETAFPGGESFQDMWRRVTESVSLLCARHTGQDIALMTHGGVIRILLAHALGMQPENIFRLGLGYAALSRIRYFGDFPVVELVNSSATSNL